MSKMTEKLAAKDYAGIIRDAVGDLNYVMEECAGRGIRVDLTIQTSCDITRPFDYQFVHANIYQLIDQYKPDEKGNEEGEKQNAEGE